jgi:vancomycin resistance protein VanW
MSLKKYLPPAFRLFLKVNLRKWKDFRSADYRRFTSGNKSAAKFEHVISITQSVRRNENFANKVYNLTLGIAAIDGIVIQPGEIFSFWRNVGRPTLKNGFRLSRNIVSGEISEDYGGGLCQLSGIVYHLSLIAGLRVKERSSHSIDIYREEDRFTPLGADATVVYGYKDLRIQNPFDFPVMLSVSIADDQLTCFFSSPQKLVPQTISFTQKIVGRGVEVETTGHAGVLNTAMYKRNH